MFEEEFRRKKPLYVSCGMSVMKEKKLYAASNSDYGELS